MNTYPGFYRASDGLIYLYADKDNYYSFEREAWDIDEDKEDCRTDTNITREYLADTKVEIESEGHKEFILKLLSVNDLYFSYLSGTSFIYISGVENTIIYNPKEIHIPLPPKESDVIDSLPEVEPTKIFTKEEIQTKEPEVVEGGICQAIKSSTAIHELESQGYKFKNLDWVSPNASKEPKTKDWPQIGDEVAITGSDCKFNVISINNGRAWIERSYFDGSVVNTETHEPLEIFESHIVFIDELKKPLTPEEELKEKITEITDKYRNQEFSIQEIIAKAIINGEIKDLSYKPE